MGAVQGLNADGTPYIHLPGMDLPPPVSPLSLLPPAGHRNCAAIGCRPRPPVEWLHAWCDLAKYIFRLGGIWIRNVAESGVAWCVLAQTAMKKNPLTGEFEEFHSEKLKDDLPEEVRGSDTPSLAYSAATEASEPHLPGQISQLHGRVCGCKHHRIAVCTGALYVWVAMR